MIKKNWLISPKKNKILVVFPLFCQVSKLHKSDRINFFILDFRFQRDK